MSTEIERKFLVPTVPGWLRECPADEIEQGYLAIIEGEREVRLRRRGDATFLTVKLGSGETRTEEEIEISADQFDALWPLTEGLRVYKRRYRVPHEQGAIEADVYEHSLSGMAVAEIEFASEAEAARFDPPSWLGDEVTGEGAYANESLALKGWPGVERRGA